MRLHDFLSQGRSRPAPTRPITFKIVGTDAQEMALVGEATAVLAFVSESQRHEAFRQIEADLAKEYHGAEGAPDVPTARHDDECMYAILRIALRDKDDPRQPFCNSVKELKQALVMSEAAEIWKAYKQFEAEEFPEWVDKDTFSKLVEDAKKNSLSALLSSFGSDVVRRSMPGLIARLAK